MSDYTWPSTWLPRRFQMRVVSNTRVFTSPYTQGVQAIDLMADFWRVQLDMTPDNNKTLGGQIEAFFDRLKGQVNRIVLWNLQRPAPLGTLRGTPILKYTAAQFSNVVIIQATNGQTLLAGDMLAIGGQLVRNLTDTVATSGEMVVEFAPRLRATTSAGASITWDRPTSTFILAGEGAPVDWSPGMFTAPSVELREAF